MLRHSYGPQAGLEDGVERSGGFAVAE